MKLLKSEPATVTLDESSGAYAEQTASFLPGILESSDDLFAAIDSDLRIVAFNAAFGRRIPHISGAVPQLGQRLDQLLTCFPTGAGSIAELGRRAFAGEALRLPVEFVGFGSQRYFDASFSPVKDSAGTPVVVAVALRDVTDQRVTELKFQAVLEATPDAMMVVRKGAIEFANAHLEQMFGYAKGALTGAQLEKLVPERLRERHVLQRVGFERQPRTRPMGPGLDLWGLKADGTEFPVEISLSPVQIGGEQLVIAAIRDVSARRQIEDGLRKESSELRQQVAMLQRQHDVPNELEVYRIGFEKAAAAQFHYAADGSIKRANEYFCRLLGFRREELVQLTVQKITHPDDVQVNTDLDVKLSAGVLDSYQIDKRLMRKDGTTLWVRLAVSVQRSDRGEPDYLIAVAEDITERKRTEEMLREAQLRLGMAAEIARVGYAELDLETKAMFLSPELKRQLGYADDELPNAFSEWSSRLHAEDRERASAAMQSLIDTPQRPAELEYRMRHKDGTDHWFLKRGIALEDAPGHARKLIFTQIDITERKAAEQRLREQAEELRLALRVGGSGSFQWYAQSGEHRWSDEILTLYGLERDEFGGRDEDWLGCLLPEDRATAMGAVERSLTTGEYAADFRIRRCNDGAIRWISARGQVFFDPQGKPTRMVGINVDVTEHRRIQAELEASKARLEAVLDSLTEGVVIFDLDGQIIDCNAAAREVLGYDQARDTDCGLPACAVSFDLLSLDGRDLPPEEWPIQRVLRGEALTDYEILVRRKDDGREIVLSHNGALVRSASGERILGVLTLSDVTHRWRAEQALQDSERRLALALEASRSAVWEANLATRKVLPGDDLLYAMLGYAPGKPDTLDDWIALIHDEDRPGITRMLDDVIRGAQDGYHGVELRYRAQDDSWRWILCQAVVAQRDAHGRAIRLVGTHTDIHARKIAEEQARKAALHDPLTGLPNRALVFEYGGHLIAAAQRSHGHVAALFIDLDRFKPINDQYGHEIGDRVLQEVARRLVGCTRNEDLVGRLGGDEFVIVLVHLDADRHRAAAVAQHVIESISRPIQIEGFHLSLSPSIGISYYPDHGNDLEALIRTADLAMYQVKQSGRANYQIYTHDLDRQAGEAYRLEARLRDALEHGGLALHYQPVIDVKSGKLISAEALVRLPPDGGETCGPETFIPIAESAGLINELGGWVAVEACRQHAEWRSEGLEIPVAINISPLQFRQRTFPEMLGSIISDSGIDPEGLQLEITESSVMESDDEAVEILNRIKSLGVKVALDDFGTGYSSLSRLGRLPLDKLKVDQSFVHGIENDSASRAVTEAILALGHNLKLEVIGEGIESEDALRYLQEHGCDQAQGFWFSEPLPPLAFAQWCRERAA